MKEIRCDFRGTFSSSTDITTPSSNCVSRVWCDEGKLIAGPHEADLGVLETPCPICCGTGKIMVIDS